MQRNIKGEQAVLTRVARWLAACTFGLASLGAIGASAPGTTITNQASATAQAGAASTMNSQSRPVTVTVAPQPGLVVATRFTANTIAVSATTTLIVTLQNTSTTVITGVSFSDDYPSSSSPNGGASPPLQGAKAGMTITNSATPAAAISGAGCTGTLSAPANGASLALTGATVPASTTCTYTVQVIGVTPGTVTTSTGPVSSSNAATGTAATAAVTVIDLPTVSKAFAAPSIAGGTSTTLTFTITNPNPVSVPSLTGIGFTDVLPTAPGAMTVFDATATNTCVGSTWTVRAGAPDLRMSGLTLASGASCTVSATVTAVTAGIYNNTSSAITATGPIALTGAPSNTASLTVSPAGAPTVTKTFASSVIALGATTTLSIAVKNNSAGALTGVAFTDSYPAGPAPIANGASPAAAASPATCTGALTATANGTSFALSGGSIPANATCTYSVQVVGANVGTNTNTTGSVTSTGAPVGAAATASISVYAPPTVSKSFGAANIASGASTSLSFTITNPNPASNTASLSGIGFSDSLPSAPGPMTVVGGATTNTCAGSTLTASAGSATVSLSGVTLASGASCTVSATVTATTAGIYNNTSGAITATGPLALTGVPSNTASLTVSPAGAPTVTKTFASSVIALGATTTLSIAVKNNIGVALTGVAFTDSYPAGPSPITNSASPAALASPATCTGTLTAAPGGSSFALSGGGIPANATCTYSVQVIGANAGTNINTTGLVTSATAPVAAPATASISVYAPPIISKSFGAASIDSGSSTTLTFTITNPNPASNTTSLSGIAFADILPATPGAMTVFDSTATNTCVGSTWSVRAGAPDLRMSGLTLASGASCTVSARVTATAAGIYNNTSAAIVATGPLALTGVPSNTASLIVGATAPTVTKTFASSAIALGSSTTLTIAVKNNSAVALTSVAFTDNYPTGPAPVANSAAPAPAASPATCTGTLAAAPGGSSFALSGGAIPANATCTYSVQVVGANAGTNINTTGSVTSANAPVGAPATASIGVYAPPTVSKSFGAASIDSGSSTSLTFTITNPNPASNTTSLAGIAFSDSLPSSPGPMTVATGATTNTCAGSVLSAAAGSAVISVSGVTLASGASCSVSVNVTAVAVGVHSNTSGAVSATAPLALTGLPSNTALLTVNSSGAPLVTKSFGSNTIALGGLTPVTITVQNKGTTALTNVAFTDSFPVSPAPIAIAGLQTLYVTGAGCSGTLSASPFGTSYSLSGGVIPAGATCSYSAMVTGVAGGTNTNSTGPVTSANAPPGAAATATISVYAPPAISKAFASASIVSGGSTTLTLTITNPNPASNTSSLGGIGFSDVLPKSPGQMFVFDGNSTSTCAGATWQAAAGATDLRLSNATLASGASCTVTASVTAIAGGIYSNTIAAATATSPVALTGGPSNTALLTISPASVPTAKLAAILADNNQVNSEPGATLFIRHTLTNTGDSSDSYVLSVSDLGGGFVFSSATLFADANDDGTPDSTTPLSGLQRLAPGQVLRFVVRLVVPAGAPLRTQADMRISAVSAAGTDISPVIDRVTLPDYSIPRDCAAVTKFMSRESGPSPAGPITVTLTYLPCDKPRSKVVITDRLPAGMRYIAGSGRWTETVGTAATAMTDAIDAERDGKGPQKIEYDFGGSVANAVNVVAYNIGVQNGGQVSFDVEIVAGLAVGTVVPNFAAYTFYDNQGQPFGHAVTNTATYRVTGKMDFELLGDRLPTAAPGSTITFTNVLTNKGDAADTYDITLTNSTFPAGSVITLLKSDGTTLLADTNGNGVPDTGVVAPGGTYRIVVKVQLPEAAIPGAYKVTKNARSTATPTRILSADDIVDTIAARCAVTLEPDNSAQVGYGQRVTYTHYLTNRGNCEEIITAAADYLANDGAVWNAAVYIDNKRGGGGSLPGGVDATDVHVTQGWTRKLLPGEWLRILVEVVAPTESAAAAAKKAGTKALLTNMTRLVLTGAASGSVSIRDTTIVDNPGVSGLPPPPDGVIRNHSDPSYSTPTLWGVIGSFLYLRADAKVCNLLPAEIETRTVVITGANGEREVATATETGPNTGIFIVQPLPVRSPPVIPGNNIIEGNPDDVYEVELLGCNRRVSTVVTLMEAVSVVFDSVTNEPVAGATVALVSAAGTQCLGSLQLSKGENIPAVTTSKDGRFAFPPLPKGSYCLSVATPNGYRFPSKVAFADLPAGRNILATGPTTGPSYGAPFSSDGDTSFAIDVPVDTVAQAGLFVQKTASRPIVELGDSLDYVVTVRNSTSNRLDRGAVMLSDDLPQGFAYLPGTARRDGQAIADPQGGKGPRLTLTLGTMKPDELTRITYRVRVGPGAREGDGVNRVQASYTANGTNTLSNIATARVQVTGGVFSEKGYVLGRVFLDCNANGVQDRGELGVAGVKLVLEDGTYVITDGGGKFSFYGLSNRTHVLKADRTTIPGGTRLAAISTRNLGDGGSRIIDLKTSEMHRADFALQGCGEAVLADVKARADAQTLVDEVAAMSDARLATEGRVVSDRRALPASGEVKVQAGTTLAGGTPGFQPVAPGTPGTRPTPAPGVAAQDVAQHTPTLAPLEEILPTLDNTLDFMGLTDGQILPEAQATLRVKGAAGTTFKLSVNGEELPGTKIGKRSVLAEKQVQAWEYFGVDLKAGDNTLLLAQVDSFGNVRGEVKLTVKAPGKLERVILELPAAGIADGKTAVPVVVKLVDAKGLPVTSRTLITLVSSRGTWKADDLNADEPGLQVAVEGGRGQFMLTPPIEPGSSMLQASSGTAKAEQKFDFLPELRNLIGAGVVEGVINAKRLGGSMVPARAGDAFEQELRTLSKEFGDQDRNSAGARAAFYLKGKIKGDYLLTAAYDSDKDTKDRLFRDIQPDEFYPVYGDSATRGFDAQSTSKLYVRIDNKRSYLLWGDFTTQSQNSEVRKLTNYSRSLTGVRQHYENEHAVVNAFASRDSTRQVIEEIRGNGTSGPYQISTAGALVNSEKVELVVRDRNQPSIIISTTVQSRFSDYEVEPLMGRILFKAPVASLDRDLNPVFVRVTYEVDQGGEQFWVAGVDAQVKIGSRVEVGGVYVKDKNPLLPFTLAGANMTVKLGEGTYVIGEAAHTESGIDSVSGNAGRVEIKHEGLNLRGQFFAARSDRTFSNPGAYLSNGRNEGGFKLEYQLSERAKLRTEALRTEDGVNHSVREGLAASIQYQIADRLSVELGLRHARESGATSALPPVQNPDGSFTQPAPLPQEVTALRAKVTAGVPGVENANVFAEAEVDVKDAGRRMFAAGGEYRVGNKGRIYGRHEFISSITGPYGLNAQERQNTTALGVDTEYIKDGRLFSEYRIRDAMFGGDTEAALGLKNLWSIAPGLKLGTTFERVQAISGAGQNDNTAIALALEYTGNPDWKGSSRLEIRDGTSQDSLLFTVGLAARLSRDWTVLARDAFTLQRGTDGVDHKVQRFQAGLSWRDNETNKWNVLGRVESRFEENPLNSLIPVTGAPTTGTSIAVPVTATGATAPDLKVTTNIVSLHADWQPVRPFLMSGRYAAKWVNDKSGGVSSKYRMQAAGARATWEFAPKWDIGFVSSILMGEGAQSRQYGIGLEVGYLLMTNLWVSGGYNFSGYKDADLAGADYTAKGAYVRLRYKFDESIFPQAEAPK